MLKQPAKLLDSTLVSETVKKIAQKPKGEKTAIAELIEDFHENGILLSLIFFSLPVAIPLPYPPGFTTIMGVPLVMLSLQLLIGCKKVWLPDKLQQYKIKNSVLAMISKKIIPVLEKIEKYSKPRLGFAKSVYCEQFVGLVCLVASIAVTLPIPFTNAIPALGISIISIGLLNRDGFIIIAGFFITVFGVLIAMSFIVAGWVILKYLVNMIF